MATSTVQCIGKLRRYQHTTWRGFYCRPVVVIYGKTINEQNGHLWNYQRLMTLRFAVSLEARIYDCNLLYSMFLKTFFKHRSVSLFLLIYCYHLLLTFVNKRNQWNKIRKGSYSQMLFVTMCSENEITENAAGKLFACLFVRFLSTARWEV